MFNILPPDTAPFTTGSSHCINNVFSCGDSTYSLDIRFYQNGALVQIDAAQLSPDLRQRAHQAFASIYQQQRFCNKFSTMELSCNGTTAGIWRGEESFPQAHNRAKECTLGTQTAEELLIDIYKAFIHPTTPQTVPAQPPVAQSVAQKALPPPPAAAATSGIPIPEGLKKAFDAVSGPDGIRWSDLAQPNPALLGRLCQLETDLEMQDWLSRVCSAGQRYFLTQDNSNFLRCYSHSILYLFIPILNWINEKIRNKILLDAIIRNNNA